MVNSGFNYHLSLEAIHAYLSHELSFPQNYVLSNMISNCLLVFQLFSAARLEVALEQGMQRLPPSLSLAVNGTVQSGY